MSRDGFATTATVLAALAWGCTRRVTADEMRNTGPLTASFGAKGFVQPGLRWSGASATATIHLVVVALY